MPIWINLRAPGKKDIRMDVEPEDTVGEIKEDATAYWDMNPEDFVLKRGPTVLDERRKVSEIALGSNEILLLVPKAEIGKRIDVDKLDEVQYARKWILKEVGIDPGLLSVEKDYYQESDHILVFRNSYDNKRYEVVMSEKGEVREYRPLD